MTGKGFKISVIIFLLTIPHQPFQDRRKFAKTLMPKCLSAEENRFVANVLSDKNYDGVWLGIEKRFGRYSTWEQLNGEEVTFNMRSEREMQYLASRMPRNDWCMEMVLDGNWYVIDCFKRARVSCDV